MNSINLKKFIFSLSFITVLGFSSFADESQVAMKYYKQNDYRTAISICEEDIRNNPNNMNSYAVLCYSLIANRQYAEAEMWASKALLISPYDQHITEVLGESKYYQGKNDEALSLFQNYISLVQGRGAKVGEVYYFMGEIFIRKGKFNHADIALSQAVKNEPLNDMWWLRLGYAREKAKNYKLASVAYNQALEINPQNVEAKNGKKRVLAKIR